MNPGVVNQYELGENEESPAGDKSSSTPNNGPEHTDASNSQKEVKSVSRLILINNGLQVERVKCIYL